jgi:hypothetical protein
LLEGYETLTIQRGAAWMTCRIPAGVFFDAGEANAPAESRYAGTLDLSEGPHVRWHIAEQSPPA